jgi:hypothetical protein
MFAVPVVLFGISVHQERGIAYSRVFVVDVADPECVPRVKVALYVASVTDVVKTTFDLVLPSITPPEVVAAVGAFSIS